MAEQTDGDILSVEVRLINGELVARCNGHVETLSTIRTGYALGMLLRGAQELCRGFIDDVVASGKPELSAQIAAEIRKGLGAKHYGVIGAGAIADPGENLPPASLDAINRMRAKSIEELLREGPMPPPATTGGR